MTFFHIAVGRLWNSASTSALKHYRVGLTVGVELEGHTLLCRICTKSRLYFLYVFIHQSVVFVCCSPLPLEMLCMFSLPLFVLCFVVIIPA